MQIDRPTQRGLNAAIGLFVLGLLCGLAILVLNYKRVARPLEPSWADREFRDTLHLGYLAEHSNDYARAEDRYRSALRMKPDRGDVKMSLGRVLAIEGKSKEAWQIYHDVIDRTWVKGFRPGGANDALTWYADLTVTLGNIKKGEQLARSVFPRATPIPSLSDRRLLARAHLYGASAAAELGVTALTHLERAAELDPD